MEMIATALPIDGVLPALRQAVAARGMAVLQAPPGAGKTSRVPLDLLASGLITGRIVMLEPRRLAARAAAARMADMLGQDLGQTVGYRIRGEAKVGPQTRIEVVTEGILTRMIQSDPELKGTGCLIFDEFHERSLNADLGLALALEIRANLRDDLTLIVMSATLDAGPVAALMGDAPVITSHGRAFPVETRWLPRPPDPSQRFEAVMSAQIRAALDDASADTTGGLLAFLPGEGEIRRVQALLGNLPGCTVLPLYGAMDFAAQRAALGPVAGRRVVLATSIAETSLTLPDITVVVDGGRSRRARFDPNSGMSRLVTERVTRAEAEQRRGRAGRVAPGLCYRLWTRGEEGALHAFPPAEIEAADLTALALELALWGGTDLPFLTPPPPGPMAEAQALLTSLGALGHGKITRHGRTLAALPLHPRLAHMLALSGPQAATLAALLAERDPLRSTPPDLALRLTAIADPGRFPTVNRATIDRITQEARRLTRSCTGPTRSLAEMAALAYPDRIGLRRRGDAPRWVLSGGKGAVMDAGTPLASARLIVATDLDGDAREARIRQATPITEAELRGLYADQIHWREVCEWSRRDGRILSRRQECFGALVLDDHPWDAPPEAMALAALEGVRLNGLPLTPAARRLRARIALTRPNDGPSDRPSDHPNDRPSDRLNDQSDDRSSNRPNDRLNDQSDDRSSDRRNDGLNDRPVDRWPEVTDAALLQDPAWLLPYLTRVRTEADLRSLDLTEALKSLLSWNQQAELDRIAPSHFTTPLDRKVPIDYDGDAPGIELRLQEMFGVTVHPTVGAHRKPLRVTLLSPAQKPVQVTMDIPGFWRTSYAEVRKDMRGQYPRHPWPEDPTVAEPTLRAKPRGT